MISFLLNFHRISSFHCLSSEQAWWGRLGGWRVPEIRLSYLWGRDLRRLKYNFEMWQLNLSQIVRLIHEKYASHRLPFDVRVCSVAQSCLTLVAPWTAAHQASLSVVFSRQEEWSGLPVPTPGDVPNPGIEPRTPASPVLASGFFTTVSWEGP